MKKRILLVDYYGTCNEQGELLGHSSKVLQDYTKLIEEKAEISVMASPCILKEIPPDAYTECIPLPHNLVIAPNNSLMTRIQDKFRLLTNLRQVVAASGNYDVIWFYRTDFFMFFFFASHLLSLPKQLHKVALIYQVTFTQSRLNRFLEWIYKKGMQHFDVIIATVEDEDREDCESRFYMPDYFYEAAQYEPYVPEEKLDCVVCLGTMNHYKKLEELVEIFNQIEYPLEIVGPFFESERAIRLQEMAKPHIRIINEKLSEEVYYEKLGKAKFTILPYDEQQYEGRTSGILLESMFVDTIPIAPKCLFETTKVSGMAYERMEELIEQLPQCKDAWFEKCKCENRKRRYEQYNRKRIQEALCNVLLEIHKSPIGNESIKR